MVKQNLGKLDRIFRFILGVWLLGAWGPYFGIAWADWLVLILGVFTLLESFAGYCWLHNLFHINNRNQ